VYAVPLLYNYWTWTLRVRSGQEMYRLFISLFSSLLHLWRMLTLIRLVKKCDLVWQPQRILISMHLTAQEKLYTPSLPWKWTDRKFKLHLVNKPPIHRSLCQQKHQTWLFYACLIVERASVAVLRRFRRRCSLLLIAIWTTHASWHGLRAFCTDSQHF